MHMYMCALAYKYTTHSLMYTNICMQTHTLIQNTDTHAQTDGRTDTHLIEIVTDPLSN